MRKGRIFIGERRGGRRGDLRPAAGTEWKSRKAEKRALRYICLLRKCSAGAAFRPCGSSSGLKAHYVEAIETPSMSRLRRLAIKEKIFFVTCNLAPTRLSFTEAEYEILCETFRAVRQRRGFLLGGYVLMPNHWHALIVPAAGDTLGRVIDALKVSAMRHINSRRGTRGPLWQPRYFDHIIRNVRAFHEKLEYMHLNPLKKGLVENPYHWRWSSIHSFGDTGPVALEVDRLELPAEEKTVL